MTEWQPIGTAPKDGTPVLVSMWAYGRPDSGERITCVARWDGGAWNTELFADDTLADLEMNRIFSPTHWMPLPQPPEAA